MHRVKSCPELCQGQVINEAQENIEVLTELPSANRTRLALNDIVLSTKLVAKLQEARLQSYFESKTKPETLAFQYEKYHYVFDGYILSAKLTSAFMTMRRKAEELLREQLTMEEKMRELEEANQSALSAMEMDRLKAELEAAESKTMKLKPQLQDMESNAAELFEKKRFFEVINLKKSYRSWFLDE